MMLHELEQDMLAAPPRDMFKDDIEPEPGPVIWNANLGGLADDRCGRVVWAGRQRQATGFQLSILGRTRRISAVSFLLDGERLGRGHRPMAGFRINTSQ